MNKKAHSIIAALSFALIGLMIIIVFSSVASAQQAKDFEIQCRNDVDAASNRFFQAYDKTAWTSGQGMERKNIILSSQITLSNLAEQCKDNKYGAISLLRLFAAYNTMNTNKLKSANTPETDAVMETMISRYLKKYPEIVEEAYVKQAIFAYQHDFGCGGFKETLTKMLKIFPSPSATSTKALEEPAKNCLDREQSKTLMIEQLFGESGSNKLDILFIGPGFGTPESFREVVKEAVTEGLFGGVPWEALAQEQYQEKINVYMYKPRVYGNVCYKSKDNLCECDESEISRIESLIGADRTFVIMPSDTTNSCLGNAFGGYSLRIPWTWYKTDEQGRKYVTLPAKSNIPEDYMTVTQIYYNEAGEKIDKLTDDTKMYNYNTLTLMHEVGHALFKFHDEYFFNEGDLGLKEISWLQKLLIFFKGSDPNCANDEESARQKWASLASAVDVSGIEHPVLLDANIISYSKGCMLNPDKIRSVKNSIMFDHYAFSFANQKASFGPVNDAYIRRFLDGYR